MRLSMLLVLAANVALAACTGASATASGADEQAVGKILDSLDANEQRLFAKGAVDSIPAAFYASDAALLETSSPAMIGHDAIRGGFTEMRREGDVRLTFKMLSRVIGDSVASERGEYFMEIRGKPDSSKVLAKDHGNYVTTFVKRNGEWKALFDIATSDVPAPAPGASSAPARK